MFTAYFSSANLSGANLKNASFNAANFSQADLIGAELGENSFNRVNFTDANLTGAKNVNLNGAIVCNTIMPDGSVITTRQIINEE